ncbi:FtsQ-type POTRA domain-containing protein [bacterium]|nr:FtsQ-type POTRA domain-containing protein [bacterium]
MQERRVRRQRGTAPALPSEVGRARRPIFQAHGEAPKRPKLWRKWFVRAGSIAAILSLVWMLFLSSWFDVRGFEVKGSTSISAEDVQKTFDQYVRQHPTERNIFFFNSQRFKEALQKSYPTITQLNINRTLFLKVTVSLRESNAALIWQVGNTNWILGDDGRILERASGAEQQLGVVQDTAQLPVKTGDKVVDRNFVSFVRQLNALAPQNNIFISSVVVRNTTIEIDLRIQNNILVKCDSTRGVREQLDAIRKTLDTADRTRTPITQYIDVRIPGRAFYK